MNIHSILKLLPVDKQMGTQSYFERQNNNSTLRPVQEYHDLSLNTHKCYLKSSFMCPYC